MKKLNDRKLRKIYDTITAYKKLNNDLVLDTNFLLEYCLELEIQNCLKTSVGKFAEEDFYNIFNSLNFSIDVKPFKSNSNKNRLVKYNIKINDVDTFKKKYYEKLKYEQGEAFFKWIKKMKE